MALNEQAAAALLPSRGDAFADRYARGLSLMDKSFPSGVRRSFAAMGDSRILKRLLPDCVQPGLGQRPFEHIRQY